MSKAAEIDIVSVSKVYGTTTAVEAISLKIPAGTYCCLLGPSGCGKTSTLRMIAGHESISSGDVRLGNTVVTDLPPAKRGTAMMFQSYALFPHLTVRDNIAFALRVRGMSKADRLRAADAMIEKVRLTQFANRPPAQLSGGQQQRVALARAAITEPRVLLLDEPLSALDEQLRVQMRQELRRMQQELGITFIHVTHTQLEAIALADLVVVMEQGRIKQAGAARDVYAHPHDRYVAEFMGGQNVLSGRVEKVNGSTFTLAQAAPDGIEVPLQARSTVSVGDKIDIAVRRDDVALVRPGRELPPGCTTLLPSRVLAIEYQGYFIKVMLDTVPDDAFVAYVPEKTFFADPFTVGDVVLATWATGS
ncbi:MAG: ABC transporter ATP-binding protein, partial [Bradyrhizobium sp.]|nr:ABC transporter ATP-binding protein [Bradyrhizobium sp.]